MRLTTLFLLTVLAIGCSDVGPSAGVPDAGSSIQDVGPAPTQDAGPFYPGLAPEESLQPQPVGLWLFGVVTEQIREEFAGRDPVLQHIQKDELACPQIGIDGDGVRWRPLEMPASGEVTLPRSAGTGTLYVTTCIQSADSAGLIAQVDNFGSFFINGAEQPGDFYRTRRYRLPAPLQSGENLVVARGSTDPQRGAPILRLWRTSHELAFNLEDMTFPDLRVSDLEPQFVGLPVLNLSTQPVIGLQALVDDSDYFEATVRDYVSVPGGAVTQIGFDLRLKTALTETATLAPIKVNLRVRAPGLQWSYGAQIELQIKPQGSLFRASLVSSMDGSVQYFGVAPPPVVEQDRDYAMILSLHGAGVQGIGQAGAYGLKDWAYIVAATNRRPFGFDWEDWGRLDALEVLSEAKRRFGHDPTQVHVTGHSMGGHGTWHVGTTHPGLFALIGPSAGWSHFDAYGGARSPAPGPGLAGAFAAAQLHSQTLDYLENLSRRAVYIIHGDADNNVPVRLGRAMRDALTGICEDLHYHEEPGAGHWWDGYPEPGAQCLDWPEMMDIMKNRRLDPNELEFSFRTAGPWVNPKHSYVEVQSALNPYRPIDFASDLQDSRLVLTSSNARSFVIDGDALNAKGITEVEVDGQPRIVEPGLLQFGPTDGKHPGQHGPLKEAFFRPWIFVYDEAGPDAYRALAAYYTTMWTFIGNGHAPALPLSRLTAGHRASHNIIYLGVGPEGFADSSRTPVEIAGPEIIVGDDHFTNSATIFVFPEGDNLSAAFYATPGDEHLLFGFSPFRSGFGLPDYIVFAEGGSRTAGFTGPDWSYDAALRR